METISEAQAFEMALWVLRCEEEVDLAEEVMDTGLLQEEFELLKRHFTEDGFRLQSEVFRERREELKKSVQNFVYSQTMEMESPEKPKVTV